MIFEANYGNTVCKTWLKDKKIRAKNKLQLTDVKKNTE